MSRRLRTELELDHLMLDERGRLDADDALTIIEFLDVLGDNLWRDYGEEIIERRRLDQTMTTKIDLEEPQHTLPFDDSIPF